MSKKEGWKKAENEGRGTEFLAGMFASSQTVPVGDVISQILRREFQSGRFTEMARDFRERLHEYCGELGWESPQVMEMIKSGLNHSDTTVKALIAGLLTIKGARISVAVARLVCDAISQLLDDSDMERGAHRYILAKLRYALVDSGGPIALAFAEECRNKQKSFGYVLALELIRNCKRRAAISSGNGENDLQAQRAAVVEQCGSTIDWVMEDASKLDPVQLYRLREVLWGLRLRDAGRIANASVEMMKRDPTSVVQIARIWNQREMSIAYGDDLFIDPEARFPKLQDYFFLDKGLLYDEELAWQLVTSLVDKDVLPLLVAQPNDDGHKAVANVLWLLRVVQGDVDYLVASLVATLSKALAEAGNTLSHMHLDLEQAAGYLVARGYFARMHDKLEALNVFVR